MRLRRLWLTVCRSRLNRYSRRPPQKKPEFDPPTNCRHGSFCDDGCTPLRPTGAFITRYSIDLAIDAGHSSFGSELNTQWPFGGLHLGRMAPCRMRAHIIADGEPLGLVCLSVHHKNIGVFMSHDLKAYAFLPR